MGCLMQWALNSALTDLSENSFALSECNWNTGARQLPVKLVKISQKPEPFFHPQPPSLLILLSELGSERKVLTKETLVSLSKGVKVLETAVGAIFAPTRFSLVRISIRDLVADGKSLVRNSGVGGGGQNRILTKAPQNAMFVANCLLFFSNSKFIFAF